MKHVLFSVLFLPSVPPFSTPQMIISQAAEQWVFLALNLSRILTPEDSGKSQKCPKWTRIIFQHLKESYISYPLQYPDTVFAHLFSSLKKYLAGQNGLGLLVR